MFQSSCGAGLPFVVLHSGHGQMGANSGFWVSNLPLAHKPAGRKGRSPWGAGMMAHALWRGSFRSGWHYLYQHRSDPRGSSEGAATKPLVCAEPKGGDEYRASRVVVPHNDLTNYTYLRAVRCVFTLEAANKFRYDKASS